MQKKYGDARRTADLERRRRGGIHRRRLHRRGRQRRARVARRLGEAAEGSEGRRRRRALREGDAVLAVLPGSTRVDGGVLQQLRRRVHDAHHRYSRVHRVRRADSALLQVEGRREDRGGAEPRSARGRRDQREEGGCRAAGPRGGCHRATATALRFSLEPFVEPSTRAGRRFARAADGAEVVGVGESHGRAKCSSPRHARRGRCCARPTRSTSSQDPAGASFSSRSIRRRIGCSASSRRPGDRDFMTVETSRGAEQTISTAKYEVTGRGGKGRRTPAARPVYARGAVRSGGPAATGIGMTGLERPGGTSARIPS